MRSTYNISETDEEVAKLSKKVWKDKIKKQVRNQTLLDLNNEVKNQKKAQSLPPYHDLVSQDYITTLSPRIARKVFHIRTGTIDLRTVRTYKYTDNVSCRLCLEEEEETVGHVVNRCPKIERSSTANITNMFTTDCDELTTMAECCLQFETLVEEKEKEQSV